MQEQFGQVVDAMKTCKKFKDVPYLRQIFKTLQSIPNKNV